MGPIPMIPQSSPFPPSSLPRQGAGGEGSEEEKLKKAAQAFEGYFVYMLFKEMQKTTGGKGLFGGATGGGIYEDLFHQAMADKIASGSKGLGLADFLMRSLQKRKSNPIDDPPKGNGLPLRNPKAFSLSMDGLPLEGLKPLNILV